MGLAGTSGSGKTYSALLLASGLAPFEKVCIIDTENGSADLYEDLGKYNVITLTAPFSPERYIEAIKTAEDSGMEVIIVDSITHEWDGKGGCLEIAEQVTQGSTSKNSYTAWAKVTPRHNAFVQAILQSPCHVITTVRRKQDYDMGKDSAGKTIVSKVGLREVTREGFEYELTLSFNLTQNHLAETSKDRTGLFMDKPEFVITSETGKTLKKWADTGAKVKVVKPEVAPDMSIEKDFADTMTELYGDQKLDELRDKEEPKEASQAKPFRTKCEECGSWSKYHSLKCSKNTTVPK